MKVKRYTYLEICIALIIGTFFPAGVAFATGEDLAPEDLPAETRVVISSYNPGFSDPYIGEFFELRRLSTTSISLAGLSVVYETSSGTEYVLHEFPQGDEMIGESLLLRLASSDEVKSAEDAATVADVTYTRNMSQTAGRISIKSAEETIDSLCWGFDEIECYTKFNSKKPTTLVREIDEEEIGDFVHVADYTPTFDAENPGLKHAEIIEEEPVEPKCRNLEFSELYTYFETSASEQFIEIFNRGKEDIDMEGCFLTYKSKNYPLMGKIAAGEYLVIFPTEEWKLTMTKNPTSSNKLTVVDTDGETVDRMAYYSGQKKGVSLALMGYRSDGSKNWVQTYNQTPGEANVFQEFKTCPAGKVINLETGNCVNETKLASTTLAACPEGKYRNPLTGRCKSYATAAGSTLKPCAEGYERNPETNRCRKIVQNTAAEYPIATGTVEEKTEFASVWAIATVIVAGFGYIAFQYKTEIGALFHRKQHLGA